MLASTPTNYLSPMAFTHNPMLERFKRQYLQVVSLNGLFWPAKNDLRNIQTQTWLYNNLFNAETTTYLPPERYQLRVVKQLLQLIEKSIEDPDEDVGSALDLSKLSIQSLWRWTLHAIGLSQWT
jgi:hypothetical protein